MAALELHGARSANNVTALLQQPAVDDDVQGSIDTLKRKLLLDPLSADIDSVPERKTFWKLLLRLHVMPSCLAKDSVHPLQSASRYLELCDKGPTLMLDKIKEDASRTFATDSDFSSRVSQDEIIRVLEAVMWRSQLHESGRHPGQTYVQGMNVYAGIFLRVMGSELEAAACVTVMVEKSAPRYVLPNLDGVHDGLELIDRCLALIDPDLYKHLQKHGIKAELFAFAPVLTFSASTRPLNEVVALWDFLLAWGVGLNILCVVAQLSLMRDRLLSSNGPMTLLGSLPKLDTKAIIPLAVQYVTEIPRDLYGAIVKHPCTEDWREG
ncbi:hypothetical protein ACM66B_005078 [Microbotryomycetes sp. NB124-2]